MSLLVSWCAYHGLRTKQRAKRPAWYTNQIIVSFCSNSSNASQSTRVLDSDYTKSLYPTTLTLVFSVQTIQKLPFSQTNHFFFRASTATISSDLNSPSTDFCKSLTYSSHSLSYILMFPLWYFYHHLKLLCCC